MRAYFRNIYEGLKSAVAGLRVTFGYLFKKSVTVHYPFEEVKVANGFRGLHHLKVDICIACNQCANACPVSCIEQTFDRIDKENVLVSRFSIDYNKCLFCWYCIPVCPTECITMGAEYELATFDRKSLDYDLVARGERTAKRNMTLFREEFVQVIEKVREKKPELAEKAEGLMGDPRVGLCGRNPEKDKSASSGFVEEEADSQASVSEEVAP